MRWNLHACLTCVGICAQGREEPESARWAALALACLLMAPEVRAEALAAGGGEAGAPRAPPLVGQLVMTLAPLLGRAAPAADKDEAADKDAGAEKEGGGVPPAGVPPSLVCLALGNLGVEPLARTVRPPHAPCHPAHPSSLPILLLLPLAASLRESPLLNLLRESAPLS